MLFRSSINEIDKIDQSYVIGSLNSVSDGAIAARILRYCFGVSTTTVNGYPNNLEIMLAMHRKEIDASVIPYSTVMLKNPDWLTKGNRIVPLFVFSNREIYDIPSLTKKIKDNEIKEVVDFVYSGFVFARPVTVPPGTPKEIVESLRKAFDETVKDPRYIADLNKMKLENNPISGAEVEMIIRNMKSAPRNIKELASEMVGKNG